MRTLTVVWCLTLFSTLAIANNSRLINGTPVPQGQFQEVVNINSDGAFCTATVVGPRVIITAGHCADTGNNANFKINGKAYVAKMTQSSLFQGQDHDISVGITSEDITGIQYASVGGKATTGLGITLMGYGCTNPGGGGGNDGVLRMGETVITAFSKFDMVSRKAGGAALCFGDSGGPAFLLDRGKHLLLGVNSKGNIQDTNYDTRTDVTESTTFLQTMATQNGVTICGINKDFGGDTPPPTAPTCSLTANPSSIQVVAENRDPRPDLPGQRDGCHDRQHRGEFPHGPKNHPTRSRKMDFACRCHRPRRNGNVSGFL